MLFEKSIYIDIYILKGYYHIIENVSKEEKKSRIHYKLYRLDKIKKMKIIDTIYVQFYSDSRERKRLTQRRFAIGDECDPCHSYPRVR